MAKQYFEMYQEVKNLKPRTVKYYKAVSKMLNMQIDKEALKRVREFRKNEYYKKGRTFSQAVAEFEKGIKYENAVIQRAFDIWSGEYLDKRTTQYANNYIEALRRNNIDSDIINFLENNKEIIKMGAMPNITEFYIPSRGKGKRYSLNIESSEVWNAELREFLEDAWNMPRKNK